MQLPLQNKNDLSFNMKIKIMASFLQDIRVFIRSNILSFADLDQMLMTCNIIAASIFTAWMLPNLLNTEHLFSFQLLNRFWILCRENKADFKTQIFFLIGPRLIAAKQVVSQNSFMKTNRMCSGLEIQRQNNGFWWSSSNGNVNNFSIHRSCLACWMYPTFCFSDFQHLQF